jgi:hypothetical protein
VSRFLRAPLAKRQFVEWKPIVFGGGGFITQLDIHADGTTVCGTDVAGAYVWDAVNDVWENIQTNSRVPQPFAKGYWSREGVSSIVIAPSDSNRLYFFPSMGLTPAVRLWRSDNKGQSSFPTNYPQNSYTEPNNDEAANALNPLDANAGNYRVTHGKIAVDPADKNIVYASNPNGYMLRTFDGGETWQPVTGVPIGYGLSVVNITFDPTSGTTGGRTNVIYCASYGNGVYRSADAGETWTQISSTIIRPAGTAVVGLDGQFYMSNRGAGSSADRHLERYTHGSGWTRILTNSTGSRYVVTAHPTTSGKIIALTNGPVIRVSTNGGNSFTTYQANAQTFNGDADGPWQVARLDAGTNPSVGEIKFDPTTTDDAIMTMGQGLWDAEVAGSAPSWTLRVRGIEELILVDLKHEPNTHLFCAGWDEGSWVRPKASLDTAPASPLVLTASIIASSSVAIDPTNPDLIVFYGGPGSTTGYSDDGGATFTAFPTFPSGQQLQFGCICVNNGVIIIVSTQSGTGLPVPYRSDDLGATWSAITIAETPATGVSGWGYSLTTQQKTIAADYVDPDTFYMSNWRNGVTPRCKGVYRSTDGGLTWTLGTDPYGNSSTTYIKDMKAVPGNQGHLFATGGHNTDSTGNYPNNTILGRSTDGGATWSDVNSDIRQANQIGLGKARTAGGYPTLFFDGFYKRYYGIYMICDGNFNEVIQLNSLDKNRIPRDFSQTIWSVEGDKDIFGRCYVAIGGYGGAYCDVI